MRNIRKSEKTVKCATSLHGVLMRDFVKTKGNDLIVEEAPIIGNLLARCFSKITEKSNEEKRSSRSAPKYSPLNDRLVHGQLKLESSLQKKDRCIGDKFVIQAILTHVFVCQRYEEGSAMFNGEIKTTIFLIKWSGYDFDDLSWEPQFSLATDALGMILNYFTNYVAVFGPLYYGPKSEERILNGIFSFRCWQTFNSTISS